MAASKLQMHVNPLPDMISMIFQRLYLRFRGLAFHWDISEYHASKPEVEQPKLITCLEAEIHAFEFRGHRRGFFITPEFEGSLCIAYHSRCHFDLSHIEL